MPSDINDDTILEFQVYSSHHVTRRHLVGVASISLRAIETLENGLVDLTIMPQTVFRVRIHAEWPKDFLINKKVKSHTKKFCNSCEGLLFINMS